MSEPAGRRDRQIAASRLVAAALALRDQQRESTREQRGAVVALGKLPPGIARELGEWQERVRQHGWRLGEEEWLLGLLTLCCLDAAAARDPAGCEGPLGVSHSS